MIKTYACILLDSSGSMQKIKETALSGFNEQIQQMKKDAKDQEIICSVLSFNSDVYEHLWNVPASELTELSSTEYNPDGGTAMRDAMGYAIEKLWETTNVSDPEAAYLLTVISDGESNSDKNYTRHNGKLRELIEKCEKKKNWTINYMGCGKEYLEEFSQETGVPISNVAVWEVNEGADKIDLAFQNSTSRQANYFAARAKGVKFSCNYASDSVSMADYSQVLSTTNTTSSVENKEDN